jgi:hypothetical protein
MTAEQDLRRLRRHVDGPDPDLAARIAEAAGVADQQRAPRMRRARGVAVAGAVVVALGAAAAVVLLRHPDPPVVTKPPRVRTAAQVLLAAGRAGTLPAGLLGTEEAEVAPGTVRDIATLPGAGKGTQVKVRAFALITGEACLVADTEHTDGRLYQGDYPIVGGPRCIAADDPGVLFRVWTPAGFAGAVRSDVVALRLEWSGGILYPSGVVAVPLQGGAFAIEPAASAIEPAASSGTLVASLRDGSVVRYALPVPPFVGHPDTQTGSGRESAAAIIARAGLPDRSSDAFTNWSPQPPVSSVRRLVSIAGSPRMTFYGWAANGEWGFAWVAGASGALGPERAGPPVYAIELSTYRTIVLTSSRVRRVWEAFANGERFSVPIIRHVAVVRVPLAHRTYTDPGPTVSVELDDGRMVDVTRTEIGLGPGPSPP